MDITDLGNGEVPRTPDFQYIKGGLDLGATSVPYFGCSVRAEHLIQFCKLPSQLPVNPERPLELEELFQRQLDEQRVENEIVQYLKNPRQLRFFNSLTVVLMPQEPAGSGQVARMFPDDESLAPPPPDVSKLDSEAIGPVRISHPRGNDTVGHISWNTDLIEPVLLDGQHRFWAIKKIADAPSGPLRAQMAESRISVLFLVLDEQAGFKTKRESPTVPEACRQIFIALNKHAEKVPIVRQQILDDRDLVAVAMRSILAENVDLEDVQEDFFARIEQNGRLPLCAVDWRSDSAKIDTGPYVTSTRLLYDVVKELLNIPEFGPEDYDSARKAVERLETRLDMGETEPFDLDTERSEIDDAEQRAIPYEFPQDVIQAAAGQFREKFGEQILDPLRCLEPYRALIEEYQRKGFVGTLTEPWFSLDKAGREAYLSERGLEDPEEGVRQLSDTVKEQHSLAYQVVFQKAIVYCYRDMRELWRSIADLWSLDEDADDERFVRMWSKRCNDFIVPALGETGSGSSFFGAGVRYDGTIDYRKTRISSIAGFITLAMLAPLPDWKEAADASSDLDQKQLKDWVDEAWSKIKPGTKPPLDDLFSRAGSAWRQSVLELVQGLTDSGYVDSEIAEDPEVWAIEHGARQLRRIIRASRGLRNNPTLEEDDAS